MGATDAAGWDRRTGGSGVLGTQQMVAFVASADPEAARAFYERTLGLRLVSDQPYALVFEGAGTTLRVQKVPGHVPLGYTVLGWTVEDLRAVVEDLSGRGVMVERFEHLPQDEYGAWSAPDGTRVVWFKDPDGNVLSLSQAPDAPSPE